MPADEKPDHGPTTSTKSLGQCTGGRRNNEKRAFESKIRFAQNKYISSCNMPGEKH